MKAALAIRRIWGPLAARLDARTARTRAALYFISLAAVYVLCQFALLNPLHSYQAALQQRLLAKQNALAVAQAEFQKMQAKTRQDPDLPNRERLREVTRQLGELESPVTELMKSLVSPEEMTSLVKTLLAERRRPSLIRMENLPPVDISKQAPADKNEKKPQPAKTAAPLYKHGLRIEVKGGFRDIVAFCSDLEKLNWKVLWDKADIKTEHYPVSTAVITVYTLSRDAAWISL